MNGVGLFSTSGAARFPLKRTSQVKSSTQQMEGRDNYLRSLGGKIQMFAFVCFFVNQLRPAAPTDSSLKWRFFRKLFHQPQSWKTWRRKKKLLQQTRQREQTTGLNDFSFSLSLARSCFFLHCFFFCCCSFKLSVIICVHTAANRTGLVVADSRRTIINPRQNPPIVVGSILFDLLVDFPFAFLPNVYF